jgi:hypothetical protein
VAFRRAEPERFGVVADEHGAMPGVDVGGAEVALFDTHGGGGLTRPWGVGVE